MGDQHLTDSPKGTSQWLSQLVFSSNPGNSTLRVCAQRKKVISALVSWANQCWLAEPRMCTDVVPQNPVKRKKTKMIKEDVDD